MNIIEILSKIKWNEVEKDVEFNYIDLSSVDIETSKIIKTNIINKGNYPSRAQQIILENDILFGTTRPLLKRFCIVPKKYNNQICSTGYCVLRCDEKKLNYKFLYFVLQTTDFYDYCKTYQIEGSYPSISDNLVKEYKIPLPPLHIQEKIVEVLDNFDKVCNDLKIGLPAEIEARKQQYEFYRDGLLEFARTYNIIKSNQ